MSRSFFAWLASFLLLVTTAYSAVPLPPAWLADLAKKPAAMSYGKADYAVLLRELKVTVDKDGVVTERFRYATRIINKEGKKSAVGVVDYEEKSDHVKSFEGWVIPATGKPVYYGKKATADVASFDNARELYGESRKMAFNAGEDAAPGTVFGYESIAVRKSIFAQDLWYFQNSAPVEYCALIVELPEGWNVQGHMFNHDAISPHIEGRSYMWELRNLEASVDEPLSPPQHACQPWIAYDLQPPANATRTSLKQTFTTWSDVSAFITQRYNAAAEPDAAMKAKADAIVAGAKTSWERIARLCRYAQNVNYISINLNLNTAGGMTPRAASRVFQCNYGDCKDKATLLRSLLRTQGIESFPTVLYSGDHTHVRPEWVSPLQFNHCIIAIKVDDSINVPSLVAHPTLGRLLIFDPTNEDTSPGWLADEDLDGFGLILAGAQGELIQLPALHPQENRFERTITAQLSALGALTGTISERAEGNSSADLRSERKSASESDYRTQIIEPWLARSLPAAHATRVITTDDFDAAKFSLAVDFETRTYGKPMRDILLVFKPVIVSRRDNISLKKGKRTYPIVIRPSSFVERAEIELPEGFTIDESFPAAELLSPFGRYQAIAHIKDRHLVFERSLELRATTLPAADYETARVFFEKILQAEQSPVVLKRL